MKMPVYLDYAATTPVDPQVAKKMSACLTIDGNFGNPASTAHLFGWRAAEAVEAAREQVASLINADVREIVFTSGATESNNLAIKGVAKAYQKKGKHIITSCIEHKAVLDVCAQLETEGFEVTYLKPDTGGRILLEQVEAALRDDTVLVSLMHVNNETGVVTDIANIGELTRKHNVLLHVDAAQSAGKLALDCKAMNIDLLSMSAHKMYGPKGVGGLYVSRQPKVELTAQMHGGGHERGMRSGTLATHQIVGLGEACGIAQQAMNEEQAHIAKLRDKLWVGIEELPDVKRNGNEKYCSSGHLNICFTGVEGETLLMALRELAVSSGSACNSASMKPSYVLTAMGLSDADADSSVRVSVGRYTTESDIEKAIEHITNVYSRLKEAV